MQNSKMYIITKVLEGIFQKEIFYYMKFILLPLNKTAQRNSQHSTKLHNKVHNVLHNLRVTRTCYIKFIKKLNSLCVLVLLNRQKIKSVSSIGYSGYY